MQTCVWVGVLLHGFVGDMCVFLFSKIKKCLKKDFVMYIKKAKILILTISVWKKLLPQPLITCFTDF